MITERNYLVLCHSMFLRGLHLPIGPGTHVGRGFADVGYEEFLWLPNSKLLSLFTGALTDFPETHRHHFFAIPSADSLVNELARRGFTIASTQFRDQREWEITVRSRESGKLFQAAARSFVEAVASVWIKVLE